MKSKIETTLAQYADDGTVVRELHDVPPYRVYEVRLDGRRSVLKIDDHPRGHAADEGRVHDYVSSNASAPVPDVLAIGTDHYLTTWDDDIDRSTATVEPTWARAAGRWLGTLHADTTGEFDGFGRPRDGPSGLELEAHDDWIDAARERLAFHRAFLAPLGYGAVVDAVDRFLKNNPNAFDGAGEPVLCHGDIHPDHLVHVDGQVTAAIDFEHAFVAPAEYDYWRTVMPYFEACDDVSEAAARAFRTGYESVRPLPEDLERRRLAYRAVNLVAFLESLFLQENAGPERREALGDQLRTAAFETLEALREK
ncbi:phosphotransferase [Natronorubrum sp. JWXQ-INN-674]|uniref:Phosphotransferase n=1 Tax=Natronorubrum halalkaliphilum TaxID=2691917 RepID=A0A6B0VSP4_9EURY|nr:aminoglycoside phosphotransferase family protein [Natronorubrum halalkaliphilum]MXV64484.1 phosphotransferase [Natronorubrum halalkaliphilum]